MSRIDHQGALSLAPRSRWTRFRLSTALGLVVGVAVIMAVWKKHREAWVPWERNGGMIGWTQAAMVARVGEPAETHERDLFDENGHYIRRSPPEGPFRTLVFRNL